MSYSVIDVNDFEGRRTPVAQALEARAIRANQFDSRLATRATSTTS